MSKVSFKNILCISSTIVPGSPSEITTGVQSYYLSRFLSEDLLEILSDFFPSDIPSRIYQDFFFQEFLFEFSGDSSANQPLLNAGFSWWISENDLGYIPAGIFNEIPIAIPELISGGLLKAITVGISKASLKHWKIYRRNHRKFFMKKFWKNF